MKNVTEVVLTVKLQAELEKMTDKEFKDYMKGKVLIHDGKRYGYEKKKKVVKQ